jgi:hypothetical protein
MLILQKCSNFIKNKVKTEQYFILIKTGTHTHIFQQSILINIKLDQRGKKRKRKGKITYFWWPNKLSSVKNNIFCKIDFLLLFYNV